MDQSRANQLAHCTASTHKHMATLQTLSRGLQHNTSYTFAKKPHILQERTDKLCPGNGLRRTFHEPLGHRFARVLPGNNPNLALVSSFVPCTVTRLRTAAADPQGRASQGERSSIQNSSGGDGATGAFAEIRITQETVSLQGRRCRFCRHRVTPDTGLADPVVICRILTRVEKGDNPTGRLISEPSNPACTSTS